MRVEDLVWRPSAWLANRRNSSIVVSSRIRLARNIKGEVFPAKAREEDRVRVWTKIRPIISGLSTMDRPVAFEMSELDWSNRHILKERHLISVEMSERGRGCGVVLRQDESVSVMVNEEDHFRIQAISPGRDILSVWRRTDAVDSELERNVPYAFSKRLGYLTSCPSNVGTGLRASVMLHLPALGLLNEIDSVIKGMTRMGLAVRGLLGEGTEASGNMFQISNQTTLGEPEPAIIRNLNQTVTEVAEHERNARLRLLEQREAHLRDYVGRAYGVLMNACLLSSREILDLLSGIRLGLDLGMVRNVTVAAVNELMLLTQPGHMQKMLATDISPEERDAIRPQVVRARLRKMSLTV